MPLRASDELEREQRGKFQRCPKKFIAGSSGKKRLPKSLSGKEFFLSTSGVAGSR